MLEKFHMDSQFDPGNEALDSLNLHKIGSIDLFLLDQILKGNIHRGMDILEVGCGYGKNLSFFLENEYRVAGIDNDPVAIQAIHQHLSAHFPKVDPARFQVQDILAYPDQSVSYDAIICLAVLHTLEPSDYEKALTNMWDLLSKGGILILRTYVGGVGKGFSLQNASDEDSYVHYQKLLAMLENLGGKLYEPASILLSQKNKPILSAYLIKE